MNKIFIVIKKIFLVLYGIIDRLIVTPISKLIYVIGSKLKKNSGRFDKFINKPYMLIFLSLLFAIVIFLAVDNRVITLVQTEAEMLPDQKVKVLYNKENYVIEGIPETVDITLIGRKSDLYLAKQLGEHEVLLDLSDYTEGTHKVRLIYTQTIGSLKYKLDPSTVTVNIKKKISDLKTVSYDLLNESKLDEKISVKSVELSKSEVVVKGSDENLKKIAIIKALIDLSNPKFIDKGRYNIDNVPLVAYDEFGKVLSSVEIIHGAITASIELTSYSIEVPLRVETVGELKVGRAISSILINGHDSHRVTIYGDENILKSIDSIPVTVDITDQGTQNKTYNVTISKPAGVRYISDSSATIVLGFDTESQRTIDGVKVNDQNLASKYVANIIGEPSISVQVKGVESIINRIESSNIMAIINLANYDAGTYEVQVQVTGDDPKVTYFALQTIKIRISAAN